MKNRNSILMAILPVLACFALLSAQANPATPDITPTPDGCYPNFNTAEGCQALQLIGAGVGNTGLGWRALFSTTAGSLNTGVGAGALVLNGIGVGNTATGAVAGLLNGDGANNTANGAGALEFNVTGDDNTAVGFVAATNTTASQNTAVGSQALQFNTGANGNTGVGYKALNKTTTGGSYNTAAGFFCMPNNIDGDTNVVIGGASGINLVHGIFNTYIGDLVGSSAPDESSVIRIADPSSGFTMNKCFIGGLAPLAAVTTQQIVLADVTTGQFFRFTSSARYKEDIKPMDKASELIFALKPVTFLGKDDPKRITQFGLIAEEVAKVSPTLVVRDEKGRPDSVKYDHINAMLLNEFLKEHKKVEEQQASISQLKSEMQTMVAQLKEQAAQIQKVSAQLEVSKTPPQVVVNKP